MRKPEVGDGSVSVHAFSANAAVVEAGVDQVMTAFQAFLDTNQASNIDAAMIAHNVHRLVVGRIVLQGMDAGLVRQAAMLVDGVVETWAQCMLELVEIIMGSAEEGEQP